MSDFFYFGALILVIAVAVWVNQRRQRPKEIRFDDIPNLIRDEVQNRVPTFHAVRVVLKSNSFRLEGQAEGRPRPMRAVAPGAAANDPQAHIVPVLLGGDGRWLKQRSTIDR